jgi:hypothetical protein
VKPYIPSGSVRVRPGPSGSVRVRPGPSGSVHPVPVPEPWSDSPTVISDTIPTIRQSQVGVRGWVRHCLTAIIRHSTDSPTAVFRQAPCGDHVRLSPTATDSHRQLRQQYDSRRQPPTVPTLSDSLQLPPTDVDWSPTQSDTAPTVSDTSRTGCFASASHLRPTS